ncbi:hypothetical protein BGW80DRAFT_845425 [Lactifluus volemus]|nr:hypothetical protein BGW80DRAFT_845425 [Lactifluus volemus]
MDSQSQAADSWSIHALDEDIFGDSLIACVAESSWERALGMDLASVDAPWEERYTTPGPSVTCIDPKLTVLWPSSPAALPPSEEEESIDGDCIALEGLSHDSADAHFQQAAAAAAKPSAASSSSPRPDAPPKRSSSPTRERRKRNSTVRSTF